MREHTYIVAEYQLNKEQLWELGNPRKQRPRCEAYPPLDLTTLYKSLDTLLTVASVNTCEDEAAIMQCQVTRSNS